MKPNIMDRPETAPTPPRGASTAEIARQMNEHPEERRAREMAEAHKTPLLPPELADRMQASWSNIQASFVDEPRRAVQEADELVAAAIKHIAETFSRERSNLESQWDRQGEVSTEDLRVALTRYRSFFHRLLSM